MANIILPILSKQFLLGYLSSMGSVLLSVFLCFSVFKVGIISTDHLYRMRQKKVDTLFVFRIPQVCTDQRCILDCCASCRHRSKNPFLTLKIGRRFKI